jgi:L-asparagine transporter-like permease
VFKTESEIRDEKIKRKTSIIPWWTWLVVYFLNMIIVSIYSMIYDRPYIILFGLFGTLLLFFGINKLMEKRNKDINSK